MAALNSGQSNFKRFVRENKSIVFTAPVLFILIIVVIIVYANPGGLKKDNSAAVMAEASTAALQSNQVEILPQTERNNNSTTSLSSSTTGSERDPFSGPLSFVGVLVGDNGSNLAIIEGNNKSYIVKKGDSIGDSLIVEEISADKITLKDGDKETTLKLEPQKDSQTAAK